MRKPLSSAWHSRESSPLLWCGSMSEQKNDDDGEEVKFASLEHSDIGESLRQLWWTIGVTVVGLALVAYFTL